MEHEESFNLLFICCFFFVLLLFVCCLVFLSCLFVGFAITVQCAFCLVLLFLFFLECIYVFVFFLPFLFSTFCYRCCLMKGNESIGQLHTCKYSATVPFSIE